MQIAYPRAFRHEFARKLREIAEAEGPLPGKSHYTIGHGPNETGFDPADLQSAYNLPSNSAGFEQTVGIVLPFNDPNVASDLSVYRANFGLPECTTTNGCFTKVNQNGEQGNYPGGEFEVAAETSLDVDMVSAICPYCRILLVEANSWSETDLGTAEETAIRLGATEVSNSWGGPEFSGESAYDHYYNHPGIPITFADGEDNGYGTAYPAASPYVIAVGSTQLFEEPGPNGRNWYERVSAETGSGCSPYESKPSWQKDTGCAHRMLNDMSATGSEINPVSIYDSYLEEILIEAEGKIIKETIGEGWESAGGTSTAAPIIAATYALTNEYTRKLGPEAFYTYVGEGGAYTDITDGDNFTGERETTCSTFYFCHGQPGYDGPSGLGTTWGAPIARPAAPAVTTLPASNIHWNVATLNGTINPEGDNTQYHFELGTTTAYGRNIPYEGNAGSGVEPVAVSVAGEYLEQNTTYHYRLVASNGGGTGYGADQTFTTPYVPPEVRIGSATLIGPTVATVHAEVKQQEYGNPRTSYFEYGPTTSYGQKTPERNETSYTGWTAIESALSGLAPKTLYHFRYVAYNNGGTAYSSDATFTTTPSPNAVTEPASEVRTTSAQLNAKLNPGGHSTTYQFEYWPTAKSSEVKDLPTSPATAGSGTSNEYVAQTLTGLTPYLSYSYRVLATNSVGTTRGEPVTFIAAAPFVAEPTPSNPEGIAESGFESVSCVSGVMCMATGLASNGEIRSYQPHSEYWTGGEWVSETIPIVPGGKNEYVGPVSCSATTRCIALGGVESTGERLSMGWNGTSWNTNVMVISGEAKNVGFNGLSCIPQAVTCFAVGSDYPTEYQGEQTAWVAELSQYGITWITQSVPRLGVRSRFAAISCAAANACTATGTYEPLSVYETFAFVDRWNGTEWKQQSLPGAAHLVLNSISCPTTTWCMAVGQREGKSVAERWNGTEWITTGEPPAVAGRGGAGSLYSVSCRSATYCTAVGGGTQADVWNGSEWSVLSTVGNSIEYRAVACQQANCTAVGSSYPGGHKTATADGVGPPVAETRQATGVNNGNATLNGVVNAYGNETTYQFEYGPTTAYGSKIPTTPGKLPAGYKSETITAALSGISEGTYHYRIAATSSAGTTYGGDRVISPHNWALIPAATPVGSMAWKFGQASCASVTSCVAVGTQTTGSYVELPLAETWNGSEWREMTTPLPSGATKGALRGVACASSSSCEAVGTYETSSGPAKALAMGWNGTSWTDQTVTAPGGARAELYAVTCTSSTSCILVGQYQAAAGYVPLAESWNGSEWKVQTTPIGTSGYEILYSISCTSSIACTATGTALKEPLALRWNGSTWTNQTTVNPNEGFEELSAVSCTSSTSCLATGESGKSLIEGPFHVLSELWNGSEWSRVSISAEGNLRGLSCGSATSCTAVGQGLIEGWNGTEWTPQTPIMPPGQTSLQLEGITCPTAAACMISGQANHGYFTNIGVIESFGAPIVNTEAVSNLQTSAATVNASVNPDGEVTTYRVEYGATTGYGSSVPTPEATIASEQSAEKVSQVISGLAEKHTYHYRVVATNSSGTTNGEDRTFTTGGSNKPPTYSSSFGTYGTGNGQLREPEGGLATDAAGNVWVSDTENSRLEEFNSKGEFVRTVGSSGEGAGQFKTTYGVTVDSKGNVWATDEGNNRVEEFTGEGTFIKTFGWGVANGESKFQVCTSSCRTGLKGSGNGEFYVPEGIVVDSKGNIFVADRGNKRVQEFNTEIAWVRNIAKSEEKEGPFYLGLDPANGNVWVAYSWDNKIGEFSNEGTLIRTWGTTGSEPGQLKDPYGVAVGAEGNIWVSEYGNNRVQVFTQAGEYLYGFGSKGNGAGQFNESPHGLAFYGTNVYVLDSGIWWENTGNSRIEKWVIE